MSIDPDDTFMAIGDFSRFSGLSVRMLRHYDQRGLLTPARVEPWNGYRSYTPAQLLVAGRIRTLRDSGCGIAQIAELLPLFDDPDALKAKLADHAASLHSEATRIADQQSLLRSILDSLDQRAEPITIGVRVFPALRVLSLRRTARDYPGEADLWADMRRLLAQSDGPDEQEFGPVIGATYFDDDYRDTHVDMAIWRQFAGGFTPRDGFEVTQLPERTVAWATLYGNLDRISHVTTAIGTWISEHHHTRTGPMFTVYVVGPGRNPNPDAWITEVNFPVRQSNEADHGL